jgi:hypothetical protein
LPINPLQKEQVLVAGTKQTGGLTRQMGWLADVPTLTATIFAGVTNRTYRPNKADWPGP